MEDGADIDILQIRMQRSNHLKIRSKHPSKKEQEFHLIRFMYQQKEILDTKR